MKVARGAASSLRLVQSALLAEAYQFMCLTHNVTMNCGPQSLPSALGALVKLKTLKASGNKLSWLPSEMSAMRGLQVSQHASVQPCILIEKLLHP
jgi:hypothetical protein